MPSFTREEFQRTQAAAAEAKATTPKEQKSANPKSQMRQRHVHDELASARVTQKRGNSNEATTQTRARHRRP